MVTATVPHGGADRMSRPQAFDASKRGGSPAQRDLAVLREAAEMQAGARVWRELERLIETLRKAEAAMLAEAGREDDRTLAAFERGYAAGTAATLALVENLRKVVMS